jgi:Spy/CpxP family protein refolding chaperone
MNWIVIALIALLAAGTAFAQPQPPSWGSGGAGQMPPPPPPCNEGEDCRMRPPPPPPGPPPLEMIVVHFADQIGLTTDQVAQIKAIADGAREEMRALHDAVRTALQSGTVAEFLAADLALRDRQAQILADVLAVLTDAQWQALQQVLPPPPPPPPGPPQS